MYKAILPWGARSTKYNTIHAAFSMRDDAQKWVDAEPYGMYTVVALDENGQVVS